MDFISGLINTEYAIFLWVIVGLMTVSGFLASIKDFFEFLSWITKVKE